MTKQEANAWIDANGTDDLSGMDVRELLADKIHEALVPYARINDAMKEIADFVCQTRNKDITDAARKYAESHPDYVLRGNDAYHIEEISDTAAANV